MCCSSPCFLALLCTHYGPLQYFSTQFCTLKEIGVLRPVFLDYVISCDYGVKEFILSRVAKAQHELFRIYFPLIWSGFPQLLFFQNLSENFRLFGSTQKVCLYLKLKKSLFGTKLIQNFFLYVVIANCKNLTRTKADKSKLVSRFLLYRVSQYSQMSRSPVSNFKMT